MVFSLGWERQKPGELAGTVAELMDWLPVWM